MRGAGPTRARWSSGITSSSTSSSSPRWRASTSSSRSTCCRARRRRRPDELIWPARLRGFFGELFVLVVCAGAGDERGLDALLDRLLGDRALDDVVARRQLEHHVEQGALDDRPQAAGAGLALERLLGDLPEGVLGEDELDVVVGEEPLELARERVLRLGQDLDEVLALQLVHRGDDRQPADELRDQPVREQVLGHYLREHLGGLMRVLRPDL